MDVGVGYQFNPWFRVDGTLEYRAGANLQSLYTLTDPASPAYYGPAQFADFYRADVSSFIGLVNGYVESRELLGDIALHRRRPRLCRQQRVGLH